MNKRSKATFLGRELGTFSGWDGDTGEVWWLYDFEPKEGTGLIACKCFQINEVDGNFYVQNDEGETQATFDIVAILANIPKAVP